MNFFQMIATTRVGRVFAAIVLLSSFGMAATSTGAQTLRPPAVPLVVSDPYFSVWSEADRLTDDTTRHWTRAPQPLTSLVRIDGKTYRIMGSEPASLAPLPQTSLRVLPTRTIYTFDGAGIDLTLTFMTPALPDKLDVLTRPVTYLTWTARATDGHPHTASVYFDAGPQLVVNNPAEPVAWSNASTAAIDALKIGSVAQPVLETPGDGIRIDWGYFYAAAPHGESASSVAAAGDQARAQFASGGDLPSRSDDGAAKPANVGAPVLAFAIPLGTVGTAPKSRWIMVAYDEIDSINYFYTYLHPYWRRSGQSATDMLAVAATDYPALTEQCAAFDQALMTDMTQVGGARYAQIGALAYRHALAGCGIAADAAGKPLLFTKENTSNGDIATVDVIFPMNPILLLFSPTLAKASLVSNLDYASSSHWKFPNAPHDLGTYPLAWGRDDGGEAMPVEESGNILILCDAIAQEEGSAEFASRWWPKLTQWAEFLQQYGLDPGDQLCTDDFMGPSPHNANLSVKAIVALAAYGNLCKMRGDMQGAQKYADMARADALHWVQVCDSAGPSSLLEFDKPGSWSQKYNMVWDKVLGLNVFPPDVAAKEIALYKTKLMPYGAPIDSRTDYAETPWTLWAATMADHQADFEALIAPLYAYLDQTTARDPLADLNHSNDLSWNGFHARPTVGGVFIKMLADRAMWRKWSSKDPVHVASWAPFPDLVPVPLAAASEKTPQTWRIATSDPGPDWAKPAFADSGWTLAQGAFGNDTPFAARVQTMWDTPDIWMRREVDLPARDLSKAQLWTLLYGVGEVYINGVIAEPPTTARLIGYAPRPIRAAALATLKPGKNLIAVHCHSTHGEGGAQFADAGLVVLEEKKAQ